MHHEENHEENHDENHEENHDENHEENHEDPTAESPPHADGNRYSPQNQKAVAYERPKPKKSHEKPKAA